MPNKTKPIERTKSKSVRSTNKSDKWAETDHIPSTRGPLSRRARCEIENLRYIAENRWTPQHEQTQPAPYRGCEAFNIPHDARALWYLLRTSSLAAREPDSPSVVTFVERFRHHRYADLHNAERMEIYVILKEIVAHIDTLFFFSLMVTKVHKEVGAKKNGNWPLTSLITLLINTDLKSGLGGEYEKGTDDIIIYRHCDRDDHTYSMEQFLVVICHELVHAYLIIFSDKQHPKHHEWVDEHKSHGTMFDRILNYVLRTVCKFVESIEWQGRSYTGDLREVIEEAKRGEVNVKR